MQRSRNGPYRRTKLFPQIQKSNDLLKLTVIHSNVTHDVVEYIYAIKAERVAKPRLIQLYIDLPSSRFFKSRLELMLLMQLSRFIDPP